MRTGTCPRPPGCEGRSEPVPDTQGRVEGEGRTHTLVVKTP